MRLMVFFDLPTETSADRREYTRFRKFLIKSGFVMMQESVYSKIILNNTAGDVLRESVRKNKTRKGIIQMLLVTEKQFASMEYVLGENKSDVIATDERFVVI